MPRHMPHPKTSPSKPTAKATSKTSAKTIAKPKAKSKVKWAKPKEPKAKSPATEAIKALQLHGLPEETIAHRIAALMAGKQPDAEHLSNASIEKQALLVTQLVCEGVAPNITAKVNDLVAGHTQVIASELKKVGAAAFMKLIPTHRNLHRHVAVLLPEYDAVYLYKQRDSSSTLSGPDGFSWKTSRTPDAENDPRFPDFW